MDNFTGILPLWQPIGQSTYQITNQLAQKYGVKAAHTGVLDPLAEGVIIVLLGEERLKKIEYAGWSKEYVFEIGFGISTDSYDGMGLIQEHEAPLPKIDRSHLTEVIKNFKGHYEQKVPLYSAQKVNGKKLFYYPKEGLPTPELPTKVGEIYDIELLDLYERDLEELVQEIVGKIYKVTRGEFRQDEIVSNWQGFLSKRKVEKNIQIAKIRVEISRGMYVRSLSQDISAKLGVPGFVTSLVRTRNGDYTKTNSKTLKKIVL